MVYIFNELQECVKDDFDSFYNDVDFKDHQYIIPALLNEYERAEGYNMTDETCVYLYLLENYINNGLDSMELKSIVKEKAKQNIDFIKKDLGEEDFKKFQQDYFKIVDGIII